MRLLALAFLASLLAAGPASAAGSGTADDFKAGVGGLVAQLGNPSAGPAAIHAGKAKLIAAAFGDQVDGVDAAQAIAGLDCVSLNVQKARNTKAKRAVKARMAAAGRCLAGVAGVDTKTIKNALAAVAARASAGRAYGAKATALRKLQSRMVAKRFGGATLHGIAFADVYDDIECIDVKVEAGRRSGALSCAKRLLRRAKTLAPAKDPITFGSDLGGTPTALPATFDPEDTEFWTAALTVPADGTITTFRVKTGDSPIDLPLRFSVVRPSGNGTVTVVTTTNPVYPLPAHDAGVHTYATSSLSFACCKVQKGDIVTVDNSGTTTRDAYVWFAPQAGATTFSHTSDGDSQNAGAVWTPITHQGYETLVQVVLQPG
ncbi:hypothetical protein DSM104299_05247 [Baekduia alba]|uniref:hypothetical protein n=1 Tax=Baekduia alba TaxID=2997333 RepID=UPI0023413D5D|nr:hypothetical protein [Baekduia alba]WCB96488.1 hypothetical protein DSM104299_05247 [Baekduia alba]